MSQRHAPLPFRTASSVTAILATAPLWAAAAWANPQNPDVKAGDVTFQENGDTLQVNQASQKAVVDWESFNIGAGETTHFLQPGADAIILNRTRQSDPSQILGTLQANGRVMLINPNGVVFGRDAVVDVNGLLASTTDIQTQDFMGGRLEFSIPSHNADAAIVNKGRISVAEGGFATLVAPQVRNDGVIAADYATVTLASGDAFALDLYGDGLLRFKASGTGDRVATRQRVENSGTINAAGGRVLLTADAVEGVVESVINLDGVVNASSVRKQGGTVILGGGDLGQVTVSGEIDVQGTGAESKGGTVAITGQQVDVRPGARINASGSTGGGRVYIGGDKKGGAINVAGRTLGTAENLRIDYEVEILADALVSGDGGRVIAWSDDTTAFGGFVSARGGPNGGQGGFTEVSGKTTLVYHGRVDLRAVDGSAGELLLDPTDITLCTACTTSAELLPLGPTIADNGAGASASNLLISDLLAQLALSDVTIDAASGTGGGTGSITLAGDNIDYTGTNARTLTFSADTGTGTINLAGVISSSNAPLDLVFSANVFDQTSGAINTNGGSINVTAAGQVDLLSVTTSGGDIDINTSGFVNLGGTDVGTGNVSVTAGDFNFVSTVTGTGTFSITGAADIAVGVGTGTMTISSSDVAFIGSGFSSVSVATTSATDAISVSSQAFSNPISFASNMGDINLTNVTLSGATTSLAATSASGNVTVGTVTGAGGSISATATTGQVLVSGIISNTGTGAITLDGGMGIDQSTGSVSTVSGDINLLSTAGTGSHIFTNVQTADGNITASNAGATIAVSATGLQATGTGSITVTAQNTNLVATAVTTNSGNITFNATDSINVDGSSAISSTSGTITLNADTDDFLGTTDQVSIANGGSVSTTSGDLTITDGTRRSRMR